MGETIYSVWGPGVTGRYIADTRDPGTVAWYASIGYRVTVQ